MQKGFINTVYTAMRGGHRAEAGRTLPATFLVPVAAFNTEVQRVVTGHNAIAHGLNIGAAHQQQAHQFAVLVMGGQHQGGIASHLHVGVGTGIHQLARGLDIIHAHRGPQRRFTKCIGLIGVATTAQQSRHHVSTIGTGTCGRNQGIFLAFSHFHIGVRTGIK